MKYIKHLLILSIFVVVSARAQERQVIRAVTSFENYDYIDAINAYEILIAKGYSDKQAYEHLGDANYKNANYQEASKWYGKLAELQNGDLDIAYLYRYAQTLKSLKEYELSDMWMNKFEIAKTTDVRGQNFLEKRDYLAEIKENSGRYNINNLPINSKESDFSPAFYNNEIIFSSARDSGVLTKNIHSWNQKWFLNLFRTTEGEDGAYSIPEKFSKPLNQRTHESSPVFTKDGQTIYFTKNNSKNGKFSRDTEGISRLKIYRASLVNNVWGNITELPFNSDVYSTAHPALNADESRLYFSSNMPGTLGESDIFYVDIKEDGSYGTPMNLGKAINTESRETFPFISESNILYFASDGHPGLGGLDVFAISLNDLNMANPVNLGEPINSEEDDFSYIINESTKKGYFASNRTGGKGDDDIYGFVEKEPLDLNCKTKISGIIKDQETGYPLANAMVTILNKEEEIVSTATTQSDGSFFMDGDCTKGEYKLTASKEAYNPAENKFQIVSLKDTNNIELSLEKARKAVPIGTDLVKYLNIEPIYFDFDKSFIRKDAQVSLEKILEYLKEYPEVGIAIKSHTDSRANDEYNERLSLRRAKATAEYLFIKGIAEARITYEGVGENELTNECSNGVPCSPEKHQSNRRSAFIVVK